MTSSNYHLYSQVPQTPNLLPQQHKKKLYNLQNVPHSNFKYCSLVSWKSVNHSQMSKRPREAVEQAKKNCLSVSDKIVTLLVHLQTLDRFLPREEGRRHLLDTLMSCNIGLAAFLYQSQALRGLVRLRRCKDLTCPVWHFSCESFQRSLSSFTRFLWAHLLL